MPSHRFAATGSSSSRSRRGSVSDHEKWTTPVDLGAYARRMDRAVQAPLHEPTRRVSRPSFASHGEFPNEWPSSVDIEVSWENDDATVEEARVSEIRQSASRVALIGPSPSANHVPYLVLPRTELMSQDVDGVCRAVARHIDGAASVQALVQRTHLPSREVLRVLEELTLRGAIRFR